MVMMMMGNNSFGTLSSSFATLMFIWAIYKQFFPPHLRGYFERYIYKLMNLVYPYVEITFQEFTGERIERSKAYFAIQNYLSDKSCSEAKRLKADVVKGSDSLVISMADHEEVTDDFNGVKVWWRSRKNVTKTQSFSFYPATEDSRYYKLTCRKNDRVVVTNSYIKHVLDEGKAIAKRRQHRKLYSNSSSDKWNRYMGTKWSHVVFEHPASFDTLAMEPIKKKEILNDLDTFRKRKDYYVKIGKAWKRGYLLYGPPGTGKSTMIAAMANFLSYDVYDLELTAVKDNTELKRLLIDTSNKSIIVIEDIDCSIDLTGQRERKKDDTKNDDKQSDPVDKTLKEEKDKKKDSKVTLSGLLNFIDGLWSACGSERIIVFTTNYIDKLDPALIRRGRMDKHIEMSYCCFESFKLLAKNYLDLESHDLFDDIKMLLEKVDVTPADVAENLLSKSDDGRDVEFCLANLIKTLEESCLEVEKEKEELRKKMERELLLTTEKENEKSQPKTEEDSCLVTENVNEERDEQGVKDDNK